MLVAVIGGLGAAALSGCERTDPYVRQGLWRPTRANDANLRAMVADPADLGEGRGAVLSSGDAAAAAVLRLRGGAARPLADSAISSLQVGGASAAPPGSSVPAANPPVSDSGGLPDGGGS